MHADDQEYSWSVPVLFFSFDCNEPVHVHAERERMGCKFWLHPLVLASNDGFSARELSRIRELVQTYKPHMQKAWNEHCSKV